LALITELLRREIGLIEGSIFRGRAANLAGSNFDKALSFAPFASQHNYDQIVLIDTGNDHRLYGLWYFGIPTLIDTNHFSSPFFHLVTSRLLNYGPFGATHNQTTLTKFDPRVLAALGVRYVITDTAFDAGTALQLKLELDPYRSQYVYELPRPNLGDYSPTRVHVAPNATQAMQMMASPDFDFTKEVVLVESTETVAWTSATSSRVQVFRDHLEVHAESKSRSIVVLPIEYSHCLEFGLHSSRGDPIEVRRANLEQTAIVFSGSLEGNIAQRYGPFRNPGCRLADYADAKRLAISAVPWTIGNEASIQSHSLRR